MKNFGPPPSITKLVLNDINSDAIWKTWINNLYNFTKNLEDEILAGQNNKSLFGNTIASNSTPLLQYDFIYDVDETLWTKRLNFGSAVINNHRLKLSVSAANNSAAIYSKEHIKYNSGTSNTILFDAAFTLGVIGSNQIAGVGDISDGFGFGYSGKDFGLFLLATGHSEYQELTITTASLTNESITIILDGTPILVPVTNSGNATITAFEIATQSFANVNTGWEATAIGNTVKFRSFRATPFVSSFSISGTTVVGSFFEELAGVTPIVTFVKDADFNINHNIDPTLLNNYKINYQWGAGIVDYYIQNPTTLDYEKVHTIKNINNSVNPIINNPNLPLVFFIENTTNTSLISILSTNISGYSDGLEKEKFDIKTIDSFKVISANIETPVLSIASSLLYKGVPNRIVSEVFGISISVDGNKPVTVKIYKNSNLTDAVFTLPNNNSPILSDSSATLINSGLSIYGIIMSSTSSQVINVDELIKLKEGESVTITAESSQTSDVTSILIYKDNI